MRAHRVSGGGKFGVIDGIGRVQVQLAAEPETAGGKEDIRGHARQIIGHMGSIARTVGPGIRGGDKAVRPMIKGVMYAPQNHCSFGFVTRRVPSAK